MKNILIIGAGGYLGSYLGNYLTKNGYECLGIDSGFFINGMFIDNFNFELKFNDARKISIEVIKKFDCVLMLAGISNDPFGNLDAKKIYDPTRNYALKIAKICKKLGVKFIFPSSCSIYGYSEKEINEKNNTNPLTPYSVNKKQVEEDSNRLCARRFAVQL